MKKHVRNLVKKTVEFIDNLSLRTKLVFTYIILITVPILIIGFRYYATSTEVITEIASKNAYEIVKKNNELIDTKLSQIMNNISTLITDKELIDAFAGVDPKDDYKVLLLDNKVSNILNKYFLQSQDIYSAQLATSYFVFAPRSFTMTTVKSIIPKDSFINSKIYTAAKEQSGKIIWIPTYDFEKMFDLKYLEGVNIDYRYMFSAVVEVKGTYYENGVYSNLKEDIEKPILVLNFKEDFFKQIYNNSIPVDKSYFFVVTKDGQIVSHTNQEMVTKQAELPWLAGLIKKKSGISTVEIDGEKRIACYSTSKVTGWVSVVIVPPEQLVESILPVIRNYTVYAAILLTFLAIPIAYFISMKITNPINKLIKAIKRTGEGNFDLKMKQEGSREAKELIHRYNIMNERIQKLINENYETKIREKEAEITALSLQLDPHFMYNTLNLISLISMENGQDEISEMLNSLSRMLKYTVKARKDLVPFKDDLEYLQSYIHIMTKRFEGKFSVEYDMDPQLQDYLVPKFFLQPFVENALIHGFGSLKRLGVLKISCRAEDQTGYFSIEDNGIGMDSDTIAQIMDPDKNSIGINNVNNRIKLIFGEAYGVRIQSELDKGTKVVLNLPLRGSAT